MNFDANLNKKSNQFSNENPDEFWNKFMIKFQNKFGINSIKKAREFQLKYPIIFNGIIGALIQEYMEKNPEMLDEIIGKFIEIIGEKTIGNYTENSDENCGRNCEKI